MPDASARGRTRTSQRTRILGLVVAVVVGGLLVIWVLPALLTRHPSDGLTAGERLAAVNDVRTSLATVLFAAGAAGTLLFTGRTYLLSRETQVTDRYIRAVSQIGDGSLEVRIGGIYALERIGRDSAADRPTVVFVLGALVRHRSKDPRAPHDTPSEDVDAALRVLSRLAPVADVTVNLRGADLRNADLQFMGDVRAYLEGADLGDATLPGAWKPPLQEPPTSPTPGNS